MIILSLVNINKLNEMTFNEASLSNNRRLKLSRLRPENSRKLCICAELALIEAIREFTGEEVKLPLDIEEEQGGRGKLFFGKESPYCGRLFFSLSHAGDTAAAAVSDHDLGMDLEKSGRNLPKHIDRILDPDICRMYSTLKEENEQKAFFYEAWTSLESYMKFTGQGLYLQTTKIKISPEGLISSPESDIKGYVHSCSWLLAENGIADYKCNICSVQKEESVALHLPA